MIERGFIGHTLPPFSVEVEKGRLRFFSKAIGEEHPGTRVPPTFLFCLEMDSPNPAAVRELLGLDLRRLLHGEQGFIYHAPAHAGDTLTFEQRIDDIYAKKNGALEFVVRKTRITNQHAQLVAELRSVSVIRND